jgi:hypothetical protein
MSDMVKVPEDWDAQAPAGIWAGGGSGVEAMQRLRVQYPDRREEAVGHAGTHPNEGTPAGDCTEMGLPAPRARAYGTASVVFSASELANKLYFFSELDKSPQVHPGSTSSRLYGSDFATMESSVTILNLP